MDAKKTSGIACLLICLTACAPSMPLSKTGPSPLVVASCPMLTALSDPSFGATARKLVEVSEQYYACRKAALASPPDD
jgi:hypothetical protein